MQYIRDIITKPNKATITVFLGLFLLHFLSINGIAHTLKICYESNGDINVESVAGSFITIPAEDAMHAEDSTVQDDLSFSTSQNNHSDINFSAVWLKDQQSPRYSAERALKFLHDIINTVAQELPRSRVFQLASFIPPLIEDLITSNLQTVVLLN